MSYALFVFYVLMLFMSNPILRRYRIKNIVVVRVFPSQYNFLLEIL